MTQDNTSGYSTTKTSPQIPDDVLIETCEGLNAKRIPLKMKNSVVSIDRKCDSSESESFEEEDCEFRPVVTPNESEPHKLWYHRLLTMKDEFESGERGAFPPFPPPPLPSTMLAASRALSVNSFDEIKKAATSSSSTNSPTHRSVNLSVNRFCPSDFRPLPPPHVFAGMIKTLAPHQYIDLTYALAGAALIEIGIKVPDHFPPLPPKIEPFRAVSEEGDEEQKNATTMSSESSSEGEYSDASEGTKLVIRAKRKTNLERREARKVQIAAKKLYPQETIHNKQSWEKSETFARDDIYKKNTLSAFIPRIPGRERHPPPLIPPFLKLPPPFFSPLLHLAPSSKRLPLPNTSHSLSPDSSLKTWLQNRNTSLVTSSRKIILSSNETVLKMH